MYMVLQFLINTNTDIISKYDSEFIQPTKCEQINGDFTGLKK